MDLTQSSPDATPFTVQLLRDERPATMERTSKRWKKLTLVGGGIGLTGIAAAPLGLAIHVGWGVPGIAMIFVGAAILNNSSTPLERV